MDTEENNDIENNSIKNRDEMMEKAICLDIYNLRLNGTGIFSNQYSF